jgi:hypothetical protein
MLPPAILAGNAGRGRIEIMTFSSRQWIVGPLRGIGGSARSLRHLFRRSEQRAFDARVDQESENFLVPPLNRPGQPERCGVCSVT